MLKYKIDVIDALNRIGFNLYQAKKTKILSQDTYNKLKVNDTNITLKSINNICMLLDMQPKDLLIYEESDTDQELLNKFISNKKK
jgi:putative transcriptional regulator